MTLTPEQKSRLGRMSRRKGQNFERLIANRLKEIWPEAKRGLQSRGGTKEVPDVEGTQFYFELKHGQKTNPKAAMEQAREGSDGRPPIAITRDNGGPILVTMDFEYFMELMIKFKEYEEDQEWLNTSFTDKEKKAINDTLDDPNETEPWA